MDDILTRALQNLFGRMSAPMALRLVIQPVMAAIFATRDGIKDARLNQPPYGWSILTESGHQRGYRLREGWKSISKVFFAALAIDVVYQVIQLGWIYIGEALILAQAVSIAPYVLLRGAINRIVRPWVRQIGPSPPG